ncbi:MAG: DUF433 domain-containing protein [Polyangiaceae bacterium]
MPAATLTTNEVAALVGLDEDRVRKEVEHGLAGTGSPPRFSFTDAVYFGALAALGLHLVVDDRRKLHEVITRAMKGKKPPARVEMSPVLDLKLGRVALAIGDRIEHFEAWKAKLVTSDDILGGEPVFPKSRLSVRNVGKQAIRGVPVAELREDYPYLKQRDIEFAKLYTLAYPKMGRPRERQAAAR